MCRVRSRRLTCCSILVGVGTAAFDDISEYDSAFTAVAGLFQQLNPKLLNLKPKVSELAPLLFASSSAKADQLAAAITADLVETLKVEKEEHVAAACAQLRDAVTSTKNWAALYAKGGTTAKTKLEATEKLVAGGLVNVAHELAVKKSKQEEILKGRCRVPRFDCGQGVSFLDRSSTPAVWRDAVVIHGESGHGTANTATSQWRRRPTCAPKFTPSYRCLLPGGPMLCEISAEGKVLTWGARAEELTGVMAAQAKASADWVEALLTGMDDMLDHARGAAVKVMSGEGVAGLYESICNPLNTTGGRPMVVAPVLIRAANLKTANGEGGGDGDAAYTSTAASGCRDPSASAVMIEAGTDIHMLSVAGSNLPLEMRLEPLNHGPLSLPATSLERELAHYLNDVLVDTSTEKDAVGRYLPPQPVSLSTATAELPPATSENSMGFGGGAAAWGGVNDAHSLVQRTFELYRSNVQLEACDQRVPIASLVFARPGVGKSAFISQAAAHAVAAHAKAGALGLIPLVIRVPHLARLMRFHPHKFGASWNHVEAYSALTHGASSTRHAMIRQLLQCRRCLLLIDGIDQGGVTSDGDGAAVRRIAAHVVEDLVLQGHPTVATARSQSCLAIGATDEGVAGGGVSGEQSEAVTSFATTRLWALWSLCALSESQERAILKQRLGSNTQHIGQLGLLVDNLLRPFNADLASHPFILSATIAVYQRGIADPAGGDGALATLGGVLDSIVDTVLTKADPCDSASPPDAAYVAAQRAILEALAVVAHASGRALGGVGEAELLTHLEGRGDALQSAWALMRRKLARGTLPLLCVLSAKPLSVCLVHRTLQEYLAAAAISHGRWPASMVKPWGWAEAWRGVARFGGEEPSLRESFGLALLAACKTQELVVEHMSGHPPTVSDALLSMCQQAEAAGSRLRIRAAGKKDVIEAARAPDQHGPCPKGDLRCIDFGLGALPVGAFHILLALLSAEVDITALNLGKNGLAATHAVALVAGATHGRFQSGIERLQLDRNALGSDGATALCTARKQHTAQTLD